MSIVNTFSMLLLMLWFGPDSFSKVTTDERSLAGTIPRQFFFKSIPRDSSDSLKSEKTLKDSAVIYCANGIAKNNSREYTLAIVYFTKAIRFDSTLASAYLNRAYAKNKLLDYRSALMDYNLALKLKLTWEESYETYFNKGLIQTSLEDLKIAMANFDRAIDLNPEYADAYYNRSIIKGRDGDYFGELADINKVISLKPTDSNAFNSRGIVNSMMGNYPAALADYTQAIELDKTNANAYFNRGIVYYGENNYLAALNDFTAVIQIKPDAEAFNRRANVKCRLKNFHGAFEDYSAALKVDAKYSSAYLNRGELKLDLKDYASAIEDFNTAIKLQPDLSKAYYGRGLAKGKLKDHKGEVEDYSMAIEYKPDFEDAYCKRGIAKYELEDQKGGCEDLNRAVKLGCNAAYDYLIEKCK